MKDESSSPDRRRLLGGCALLLLCGGVALLTLTTLRVASPTPQSDAGPIPATAVPAGPTADHAADGKLPPPTETANPAAIPTTIAQQPVPERAVADLDRLYTTCLLYTSRCV